MRATSAISLHLGGEAFSPTGCCSLLVELSHHRVELVGADGGVPRRPHQALHAVGDVLVGRRLAGAQRRPPAAGGWPPCPRPAWPSSCATRAAICGSGGPSAATPLGGVAITRVTSAWIVDSRSATLRGQHRLHDAVDQIGGQLLAGLPSHAGDDDRTPCGTARRRALILAGASGTGRQAAPRRRRSRSSPGWAIFAAKAAGRDPGLQRRARRAPGGGQGLQLPDQAGRRDRSPGSRRACPDRRPTRRCSWPRRSALACWAPPAAVIAGTELLHVDGGGADAGEVDGRPLGRPERRLVRRRDLRRHRGGAEAGLDALRRRRSGC